jgi:hypothetical protein
VAVLLWVFPFFACEDEKAPKHPPVVATATGEGGAGEGGAASPDAGPPTLGFGGAPAPTLPHGPPCNGRAELCDRRYDQVAVPVTHAAMANTADLWSFPAQTRNLRQQLDDSIRGLWLEVRALDGKPALCFGDCGQGHTSLRTEFGQVRSFLDANPREIVTLLVDNYVPASDIVAALDAADLTRTLGGPDAEAGWPTLADLIASNTRLVVFLRDAAGAPAECQPLDAWVRRTTRHAQSVRDLTCEITEGAADAPLLLVNEFLVQADDGAALGQGGGEGGAAGAAASTPPGRPSLELAASVNHNPELTTRLQRCASSLGQIPNFVAVDFYDASDVVTATQQLNGLIPVPTE